MLTYYQRDCESLYRIKRVFAQLFSYLKAVKYRCQDWRTQHQSGQASWLKMLLILLLTCCAWSVHGHGGMVWPPIWQDGNALSLDDVYNNRIFSDPVVKDPKTGKAIDNTKAWVTDQAYTGGHGAQLMGSGPHTNDDTCNTDLGGYYWQCATYKHPWAAPGVAPSLGGGCGIHGGNPFGCPANNDSRPAGSQCGQVHDRGTWSFGSSALEIEFPQAMTTKWVRGSAVPVGFVAIYHGGGYTYRLCKMPAEGKAGLTEECFARNVLEFADDKTYWRDAWYENKNQEWKQWKKTDITVGTYPEGSAWRYHGPNNYDTFIERFYKDHVLVPEELEMGEYVLSWRWDAMTAPQVWVSCANIEIVDAIAY